MIILNAYKRKSLPKGRNLLLLISILFLLVIADDLFELFNLIEQALAFILQSVVLRLKGFQLGIVVFFALVHFFEIILRSVLIDYKSLIRKLIECAALCVMSMQQLMRFMAVGMSQKFLI